MSLLWPSHGRWECMLLHIHRLHSLLMAEASRSTTVEILILSRFVNVIDRLSSGYKVIQLVVSKDQHFDDDSRPSKTDQFTVMYYPCSTGPRFDTCKSLQHSPHTGRLTFSRLILTKETHAIQKISLMHGSGPLHWPAVHFVESHVSSLLAFVSFYLIFSTAAASSSYSISYKSMTNDLNCTEFQATLGLSLYAIGFGIVPLISSSFSEVCSTS